MDDEFKTKRSKRQMFSVEEDKILAEQVKKHGERDWSIIATKLPGRTARQCRERFKNYLSPNVTHAPWKAEEDNLLRKLVQEIGPKWTKLAEYFPKRTDVLIKNRWSKLHRQDNKLKKSQSSDNETTQAKYIKSTENMKPKTTTKTAPKEEIVALPSIQDMMQKPSEQIPSQTNLPSYSQENIVQSPYLFPQTMLMQTPLAYQMLPQQMTYIPPVFPLTPFLYPHSNNFYLPSYQRSALHNYGYA